MTLPHDPPVVEALLPLLDASADPFFALDADGRFTYANPAAGVMVGAAPADLLGKSLELDFPHTFSDRWPSESRRARAEGRPVEYDAFSPAFLGWVRVHVAPGASGALAVRIQNVTQQRRTRTLQRVTAALAEARDERDVVAALLGHAAEGVGAYLGIVVAPTADGEHLGVVDATGYGPELLARHELVPLHLHLPPCDAARRLVPVFAGGADLDRLYPDPQGLRPERTRSIAALPLAPDGALWGVLSLGFEQTRRFDEAERAFLQAIVQQGEQALARLAAAARSREQAEILATLNRVNRTVSAELDLGRLVQAVTDAGVELTGAEFGAFFYNVVNGRRESYTLYTLSGVPREAFAAFPMPRNTRVFGPTFAGEDVLRVADITRDPRYGHNAPHRGMPGGHLPVRSYLAVPVVSRSGEVLGGLFFGHAEVGVFTEQAEQLAVGLAAQTAVAIDNARLYGQLQDSHAELERRVEARTAELRRSNEDLEKFAFVASHDLQEPLRTIASFADLLGRRHGDALDDTGRKYLSLVAGGAERMKALIHDLLVFSRLGTAERPLVPVPLGEPLDEALARLHDLVERTGARVHRADLPVVCGAAPELAQLLQNLIGNAVKFRREGVPPEVHVAARREGAEWHVEVRDNGSGFDPKYAERVFDLFQRLHRREEYEGTGMGLAIVRKIVERHGGRVWAESTPGAGSTFHFTLPAASPDA